MFSRIRQFLKRHKRKFVIGGTIVGSVIFLTRFTQYKLRECHDKEIKILLDKTKKQQYYDNILKTCDQMILSLATTIRKCVIEENNLNLIICQLQDESVDKIAAWNQLKVLAFTRSTVIIYSYTMLVTLLRIQFSLISGYLYKSARNKHTDIEDDIIEFVIQRKYIELSRFFIFENIIKLNYFIKKKVTEVIASVTLTERLTLNDLEQIYSAIISSISADISGDPIKNCIHYMLPENDADDNEIAIYAKLVNQTVDVLQNEEVQNSMQENVLNGSRLLIDHISTYFNDPSQSHSQNEYTTTRNKTSSSRQLTTETVLTNVKVMAVNDESFININKTTIALARLIPIINKQIPDNLISTDATVNWLHHLMLSNELKTIGANIFEAVCYVQSCINRNQ